MTTMVKQVKGVVEQSSVAEITSSPQTPKTRNLFVKIDTFDPQGKDIGTRIVDMYHFGTRNWLQNHHWWAMHNGHTVEANPATDKQVTEYLATQRLALADKFNTEKAHVAA